MTYLVKKGDTALGRIILKKNGIHHPSDANIKELEELNPQIDFSKCQAGQTLKITLPQSK